MIKIFSDFCLLKVIGLKYMIIEKLDHDESGDFRINIISTKELLTTVVNIKHSDFEIYIGRWNQSRKLGKSLFHNPFKLTDFNNDRDLCLSAFKDYFFKRLKTDTVFKNKVSELKGKKLGCWCKPQSCHGDIIINYLENTKVKSIKQKKLSLN